MKRDHETQARALLGTPFRPQGRSAAGLDCLGLMLEVYQLPGDAARRDYRLRGDHGAEIRVGLKRFFRSVPKDKVRPGDALLLNIADDQLHFAIACRRGFIHAHAGIGKVVECPGPPPWPLAGAFRRKSKKA